MQAPPDIQFAALSCESKTAQMVRLSRRELQVLARLSQGDSYKEIAQGLGLSVQTVNHYTKSLYRKLDVHSRAHAVIRYLRSFRKR